MPVLNFSFLISLIFCPSYSLFTLLAQPSLTCTDVSLVILFPLVFGSRTYTPFSLLNI